jgi:hypothetical protein
MLIQPKAVTSVVCVIGLIALGVGVASRSDPPPQPEPDAGQPHPVYQPRQPVETSGVADVYNSIPPWAPDASLGDYASAYKNAIPRGLAFLDEWAEITGARPVETVLLQKACLFHAKGDPVSAYKTLENLEARIKGTDLEAKWQYTVVYCKGVTALRMGENDNCVLCRGESSCIFPISPAAVHTNPAGSRLAIKHFTEYLQQFPEDLEVKWLLNLAHMTLGEYPARVDPRYRLNLDACTKSECDIGQFSDVSHLVGVNRFNQSGGAIMEDFDNDGLLDIVVTDWSPSGPMAFYRNKGDGTFEDRTEAAGLDKQTGGLYCVQTDYNNDGYMDIFVPRGAWLPPHLAQRPSLLRNNGNGTFTDVTREAGLLTPVNSHSATWADYDNDGFLDLFVCCQHQPCRLYHNKGDGTFEEVAGRAGLPSDPTHCLGATWIDYDSDGYPDLFMNAAAGPQLYHNNRNGTFTNVTKEMGIDGPTNGFPCWAFDFDNDGHLDIFALKARATLEEVIDGLMGRPRNQPVSRLYRNLGGNRFQDVAKEMGVDQAYAPMGCNFGDLTNDGFLDFYLGTGGPPLSTLVPNRLFKNMSGKRFAEVTASSRTGHLQKGHGVACGDWRRCGYADIFIQLGGAVEGDRYHNVLFQNPGRGNNWLNVKLIGAQTPHGSGRKTNRAAIGARIKVVTAGENPLTVYRWVSSGSSFGANPLEQAIGLGKADRIAMLEVYWPTSGTTQTFRDLPVDQFIEVTEFASDYRKRSFKPISVPK